jgi:c-di-GMP-binding flagellar brake protein YcgR
MAAKDTKTNETDAARPAGPAGAGRVSKVAGVHLNISPGKDVVVQAPGAEQGYRGRIVGYAPYEYIIAQVRLPSSVRKTLSFGGQVVLKYLHKGTVYGFRASILNSVTAPAPLLILEYPDAIEKIELRRNSRHRCQIDGLLHTSDAERDCLVVNVSEAGCKVSARSDVRDSLKAAKVDDVLAVSMNLGSSGMLKVPISVRSLSFEEGIVTIGSMFLDIRKEEVEMVQQYLEKISRLMPRGQA